VPILKHLLVYFYLDCWVELNIEQVWISISINLPHATKPMVIYMTFNNLCLWQV
jgi:hypothetical protein